MVNLENLEHCRLIYDLVFCYKMLHGCVAYLLLNLRVEILVVIIFDLQNISVIPILGNTC